MKRLTVILSFFILTSLLCLKAQVSLGLTHRHELKLNLLTSVLSFPEVSYEYIFSNDFSVGAAMLLGFDKEDGVGFRATPFARWYFCRKDRQPATGFFLEANGAVGTQYIYSTYSLIGSDVYWKTEKDAMFAVGLGLAVGWKYLLGKNWTGELLLGLGRNFIYDKIILEDDVSGYLRIGICIGKRF